MDVIKINKKMVALRHELSQLSVQCHNIALACGIPPPSPMISPQMEERPLPAEITNESAKNLYENCKLIELYHEEKILIKEKIREYNQFLAANQIMAQQILQQQQQQ